MFKVNGYAAQQAKTPLAPFIIQRRDPLPTDIQIEVLYCGVCHSDLHIVRNEWKSTIYPCVPGHEIVGRVVKVGEEVDDVLIGDLVAVGCMIDSCHACPDCKDGLEQYCSAVVWTYNSVDPHSDTPTFGGYSTQIVVDEKFVLRIPKQFKESDLARVAPLLCAGITTYSPLKHWKVSKGSRVGVVGLGGLGHMAVKLAHAMGAHVVLFTSSPSKVADAKRLGADEVVISKKPEEMENHVNSLDFIINTVAASHQLDPYLASLKRDGTMCLIGVPENPHPSPSIQYLITKRRSLAGSLIGSVQETQELLDFCAEYQILSDVEVIPIQKINEAYERMLKSDVKYRFVIDMASLK